MENSYVLHSNEEQMHVDTFLFNFAYALFAFCIVFPPNEFQSAGFTIEKLFSSTFLESNGRGETLLFVEYNMRRISLNLVTHSMLPLCESISSFDGFGTVCAIVQGV